MTQATTTNIKAIATLDLNETAVATKPCIPAREVRVGDTFFASGFRSGGCRRVLESVISDGSLYVRVVEGWYRWQRVYAHVAAF